MSLFPSPEELGGQPQAAIVLVHGTFSPDAEWTRENSDLVKKVRERFNGVRATLDEFKWRGFFGGKFNNTHFHRYAASVRLAKRLVQLRAEHPDARLFVVGHSHGGNVALYADKRAGRNVRLDGIVCMGTPYIEVVARSPDEDVALAATTGVLALVAWLALLAFSTIAGLGGTLAGLWLLLIGPGYMPRIVGAVTAIISFAVSRWYLRPDGTEQVWVPESWNVPPGASPSGYGGAGGRFVTKTKYVIREEVVRLRDQWVEALLGRLRTFAERKQAILMERLTATAPGVTHLLCVRTRLPDEALRALDKADSFLGLPRRLLRSRGMAGGVAAFLLVCPALAGLGLGGWLSVTMIRDALHSDGLGVGVAVVSLVLGFAAAYVAWGTLGMLAIVILALLAPLSLLLRAPASFPALLAYGSADLLAEYFIDTRARAVPVGWNADSVTGSQMKQYAFDGCSGLRHCYFYKDPQALNDIAVWLRARHDSIEAA